MVKLGISVYPDLQSFDEIRSYIEKAAEYGFSRVFSSMWSVEGTKEEVIAYFDRFIQTAHKNRMEVNLDVNPDLFERLGASPEELSVFNDLGVDILRLDTPFDPQTNKAIIKNPYDIKIEFNASIVNDEFIDSIKEISDEKAVLACHNFYPQRYTGMKWQKYLEANRKLKQGNISIGAFVTSHNRNTIGVWDAKDGLCTVEKMRDMPLDTQIRMLMAAGNIDSIIIGNACASEEELKLAQEAIKDIEPDINNPVVAMMLKMGSSMDRFYPQKKIRVKLSENITENEKDILLNFFPHNDVGDSSEWIWRSRMARFLKKDIPYRKEEGDFFEPGTVMMVNNNYAHYAGEVQIALLPVRNDGIRNKIAYLSKDEMEILKLVKDFEVVVFLEEK